MNKTTTQIIILLLFQLSLGAINAQNVLVVDQSGTGIPFANIYVPQSSYGVMTDANGSVDIDIDRIQYSDTIRISCIGFEDRYLFKKELEHDNSKITLKGKVYAMEALEVSALKIRYKKGKAGIRTMLDLCQVGFFTAKKSEGKEQGVLIKNDKEGYIEDINFNLAFSSHDSMLYEINIYEHDNTTLTSINKERIFIVINKSSKVSRVDISAQKIKVKGDFIVSFEAVDVKNNDSGITFKASCNAQKGLLLKENNGTWSLQKEILPAIWCRMNFIKSKPL